VPRGVLTHDSRGIFPLSKETRVNPRVNPRVVRVNLLNIEHRLMLHFAPDLEFLTLLQVRSSYSCVYGLFSLVVLLRKLTLSY